MATIECFPPVERTYPSSPYTRQKQWKKTQQPTAQDNSTTELDNLVRTGTFWPKSLSKFSLQLQQNLAKSRREELLGLVKNGIFKPVNMESVPPGTRVFESRFVDESKRADIGVRYKSRLVAQNYADEDAASVATKAPTVQRFSQRLVFGLSEAFPNMNPIIRDIAQAYTQSTTTLERDVYIKPPLELGFRPDTFLKVVKPLYGIPESGLHWYLTYLEHHLVRLGMERSKVDTCVLLKRKNGKLLGTIILQVDDSYGLGTLEFLDLEERAASNFLLKPRI